MRPIKKIHGEKPHHWVGDGFYVQTMFNHLSSEPEFNYTHTDPFLLLDYAEPTEFVPNPNYETEPRGVGQHPHKGFETVTIAYAGEVTHTDSAGGKGIIFEGDVQWMTAGRGIMHEEFHSPAFGQSGGTFSMVQLWVNLPREHKLTVPNYQALTRADMPIIDLFEQPVNDYDHSQQVTDKNAKIGKATIIAGNWQDQTGTATTFTPINLWDIELNKAGSTMLDIPSSHNIMLLVQEGELLINNRLVTAGKLIQFEAPIGYNEQEFHAQNNTTDTIKLTYPDKFNNEQMITPVKLLLMSGKPIGEPVAGYGPFVMTTPEELKQTFRDYQNGNFG